MKCYKNWRLLPFEEDQERQNTTQGTEKYWGESAQGGAEWEESKSNKNKLCMKMKPITL